MYVPTSIIYRINYTIYTYIVYNITVFAFVNLYRKLHGCGMCCIYLSPFIMFIVCIMLCCVTAAVTIGILCMNLYVVACGGYVYNVGI